MIRGVALRNFKRFGQVDIAIPGHVVLAGPNNTGKTTLLQAIAAFDLALRRWRERNSSARPRGTYPFASIARPDFLAVPVRALDLLWNERRTSDAMSIRLHLDAAAGLVWLDGERELGMEFEFNDEQVRVRPTAESNPSVVAEADLSTIYVPPMTGLVPEEPLYAQDAFIEARLAEGRPGEVLRNLLVRASQSEPAWRRLEATIKRLFGYVLLPPNERGRYIVAEYRTSSTGPQFDIASAGSGFQQVLMLMTFLVTRPRSILLLDEPDAHLHVLLQDAIYSELRDVAASQRSQLILATHSEVIIDSVDPSELMVTYGQPRVVADRRERQQLIRGLRILSNTDVMLAEEAPGVLYVEGFTDVEILRAWARVLRHPAEAILATHLFWHKYSDQTREGGEGFQSRDHFHALQLVRPAIRGLEIQDRDGNPHLPETQVTGSGLQRVRWRRYEIESYLVHPDAIERFIVTQVGQAAFLDDQRNGLRERMARMLTPDFVARPMEEHEPAEAVLTIKKARTEVLPSLLSEGGLPAFAQTRFHELAAVMRPEEVHPDAVRMLDAICTAFGRPHLPPRLEDPLEPSPPEAPS